MIRLLFSMFFFVKFFPSFHTFHIISFSHYFKAANFTCHDIEDGSPRHKRREVVDSVEAKLQEERVKVEALTLELQVWILRLRCEGLSDGLWVNVGLWFVGWFFKQHAVAGILSLFVLKFGTLASDLIGKPHSWNKIQVCTKEEKKWSASLKQDLAKTQAECETQFDHQSLVYLVRFFYDAAWKCQDWKHHWWKVQPVQGKQACASRDQLSDYP